MRRAKSHGRRRRRDARTLGGWNNKYAMLDWITRNSEEKEEKKEENKRKRCKHYKRVNDQRTNGGNIGMKSNRIEKTIRGI
jgi:hypothetical protein